MTLPRGKVKGGDRIKKKVCCCGVKEKEGSVIDWPHSHKWP